MIGTGAHGHDPIAGTPALTRASLTVGSPLQRSFLVLGRLAHVIGIGFDLQLRRAEGFQNGRQLVMAAEESPVSSPPVPSKLTVVRDKALRLPGARAGAQGLD